MKKKLLSLFLAVSLCAVAVFAAGCNEDAEKATFVFLGSGQPTYLNIDAAEFEGKYIIDVLRSEAYGEQIDADISESEWGAFLNSIFGIVPNGDTGEYIALYSTLSEFSMGEEYQITLDDRVYYSSNVGIDELLFKKGEHYLFKLEVFEWTDDVASIIDGAFA